MCGRYGLTAEAEDFVEEFDLFSEPPSIQFPGLGGSRYDIRPMQRVPILRLHEGHPQIIAARWGFTPSWARKSGKKPAPIFNTRSEKLHSSSYWKRFLANRCLVPASFFYEWQEVGTPKTRPWMIKIKERSLFAFAGIYAHDTDPKTGEPIEVCSILTTDANPLMRTIHNRGNNPFRQPVILENGARLDWLSPEDPEGQNYNEAALLPLPEDRLDAIALSQVGNDTDHTPPVL